MRIHYIKRLIAAFLIGAGAAHGAMDLQILNVLNIKRGGGTAVGSFDTTIGDNGPNFQLGVANQSTFNIRNNGGGAAGIWEWRGSGVLEASTTVSIPDTATWSSGVVSIDESLLAINADRFNPTSVAFLIGRWNSDYYAFRFGLWNNGSVDNFRLYGVESADVTITGSNDSVIPEPGSFALIAGIVGISFVFLRRSRRKPM